MARLQAVERVVSPSRVICHIQLLMDDLHHQLARHLVDVILPPAFHTGDMVARSGRVIGNKTVRLTWRHHSFQQFLQRKARERPHCRILLVNEGCTSKTCSQCDTIHPPLKGSRIFLCPTCDASLDRDTNGACNIHFLTGIDAAALRTAAAALA